MEKYNVRFLEDALNDLEEIVMYIAQDNRAAAIKIHDEIVSKANDLSTFPRRGPAIPDTKMKRVGFRVLYIKPYIAFYRIIDNDVFIYRVLHGAMNYPLLYEKMLNIVNDEG